MADYPFHDRTIYPSIKAMLEDVGRKYQHNIAYQYWEKRNVVSKTYAEFFQDVCAFTAFLEHNQLLGQHIALIGKTSYLWLVSYFGIISSGSVVVPIDKELEPEAVCEQLAHADVAAVLCDKTYQATALGYAGDVHPVFVLDAQLASELARLACPGIIARPGVEPDSLATIVFTSGTSGKSKAVMLSQQNIITDACCVTMVVDQNEQSCALSVLPTNHMFEIASSILCALYFGARLCINDSLRNIKKNLQQFQPTVLVVVPLFVDTFYKEIRETIKRKNMTIPFEALRRLNRVLKRFGIDKSKTFFSSIHQFFGGNLQMLICGGALLDPVKINFFNSIGIYVLQGYGITECAPAVACHTDLYTRPGAVGKVLPCCQAKAVDGEIVVRGTNVMLGYYKDPEQTREVLRDGWFYTGDLGRVDEDGYIYLTGRKKNLIILSNGENVSPEEIELKLQDIPNLREIVISCEDGTICAEIYSGSSDPRWRPKFAPTSPPEPKNGPFTNSRKKSNSGIRNSKRQQQKRLREVAEHD